MTPRMSALDPAGPQADAIKSLWDVFYGVSIAVWSLVVIAALIAAVRAARRREDDPRPANDRRHVRVIIAAGALTVVTLVGLLLTSVLASRSLSRLEHAPDALPIEITANQWWWNVTYWPDDPKQYTVTANEIHVPVGRTVHLRLTSNDVIHSFWVPSLHGKRDLIPGRVNRTWIRADQPGAYRGQCAEFCGLQHAQMGITVVAEPADDFERWLAAQRQQAAAPETEQERRGQTIFLGAPCAMCHSISGTPAGGRLGPDLSHFASRKTLGATPNQPNTPENLRVWLRDPHAIKPGIRMPAIALPDRDLDAIVAYLGRLK